MLTVFGIDFCHGRFRYSGTRPGKCFQRKGMGNALVQYGNRMADEAGLPIFLQASPYGYPIYENHGFETV